MVFIRLRQRLFISIFCRFFFLTWMGTGLWQNNFVENVLYFSGPLSLRTKGYCYPKKRQNPQFPWQCNGREEPGFECTHVFSVFLSSKSFTAGDVERESPWGAERGLLRNWLESLFLGPGLLKAVWVTVGFSLAPWKFPIADCDSMISICWGAGTHRG